VTFTAQRNAREAFVIMPIKAAFSEEHRHFRALYDDVVRPALVAAGYDCVRADDVQKTGAVTRDVIDRLARFDLVVADLTDLNPNVFYELGIRHVLRGSGTILLLDDSRTKQLPFDVMPYRAILYESDVAGVAKLRSDLTKAARDVETLPAEHRDSPVHDALPALPADVLAVAEGSTDRATAEQLESLRKRLREYERRFGPAAQPPNGGGLSPIDTVLDALGKAEKGELPRDLVRRADAAVEAGDSTAFLEAVRNLLGQEEVVLERTQYNQLYLGARALGLRTVGNAIYEAGIAARPRDEQLRFLYLSALAQSPDPRAREKGRAELLATMGFSVGDDGVVVAPDELDDSQMLRLGHMLDAYHEDNLNEQALSITSAVVAKWPDRTVAARNHARALRQLRRPREEIFEWYRRAVLCPDVTNHSAEWFGVYLFNSERYVDSLEAYLLAAVINPDAAGAFSEALDSGNNALRQRITFDHRGRQLPSEINFDFLETAFLATCSCPSLDQPTRDKALRYARGAEIPQSTIETALGVRTDPNRQHAMTFEERHAFAVKYYELLRSEVTAP
jgi:tetratricopeptide (TPR) repeat protein